MQPSTFYRNDYKDMGALPINQTGNKPQTQTSSKPKRSGVVSLLPMAASIIGGVGGSLIAPGLGTAAGGAAGGALGEWLAQKLSGEANDGVDKGNIVQEGAFGVLGGIGKAAKSIRGATTALKAGEGVSAATKIARFGVPVAEKVAGQATEKAAAGGVRGWLGNKLLKGADDTALRASQLSGKKEALKGFEKRFGEDLGTYLRKNDLIGKTGKDVEETVISGLNKKYSKLVGKIDRPITSSDVLAQNMKKGSSLEKLLQSGSTENKRLADDVFAELDSIFKEGGKEGLSAKRVAELKTEYQKLAKNAYKLGSNTKASVNEKVAEFLKKTLQGVSGSDELATTGKNIDKAFKASDLLASAAQNGRGTLSLGLTDLMAAGGGGAVGSIPGAVAAVAGKRAINSPKVQSFIANKLAQGGEKLLATGAKTVAKDVIEPTVGNTIKGMLKAQVPARIASNAATSPDQSQPALTPTAQSKFGAYDAAGATTDQANIATLLNGGVDPGSESQYSRESMIADIKRDPKNSATYLNLYKELNPEPQALSLSDSAISKTTDAEKALSGLDELDALLSDGYAGGKISGNIRKLNPLDDSFKQQQASVDRIRQIVGKALEGGVLRKEDEEKYRKILPTMQDQPNVFRDKVSKLRQMISTDAQQYIKLQQQYGKGAGQVSNSDLQSIMTAQ